MAKIEKEIGEVQAQVDYHCDKIMEYFENQSRRNNIRIHGIPEQPDETWEKTERKANMALESKLNPSFEVQIERAHRTGKANRRQAGNASSKRPRTMICRLENWKQKNPILKAARTVNPDGMFVNEDLNAEILQRLKELLPKLKQAKQVGKIAYFRLHQLIIRDRPTD